MPKTLEIIAYGPIGAWYGVLSRDVLEQLRGAPDATEIIVRIHSDGGDALEGLAIATLLRAHPAHKTIQVDGVCASAATPMLCVGEVVMTEGSMVMLHNVRAIVEGDANDLRANAEIADKITAGYNALYALKTGKGIDEIAALVAKNGWAVGSWLTPQEALTMGLADRVGPPVELMLRPMNARVANSPAARFAASAKGDDMAKNVELRKKLGLSAEAPRKEVLGALKKLRAEADGEEKEPDETLDEGEDGDEGEGKDGDEKMEALKAALADSNAELKALKAQIAGQPDTATIAAEAQKREARLTAEVDGWIKDGRCRRENRERDLALHRQGKLAARVALVDKGTYTTSQSLRGGGVGTEVHDLPERGQTPIRSHAKQLVASARNMGRGAPSAAGGSDARNLMDAARNLGRGGRTS